MAERPAPSVKNLHRLCACGDLRIQIHNHRVGQHIQNFVQQIGALVHHGFDEAKLFAAAAFYHVTRQGKRAARKTNQRHAAIQSLADAGNGIGDIAQFVHIGHLQSRHIGFGAYRAFKFRAFTLSKIQTQAHGIGDGQNV